jgi:hypothetical protein
MKLKNSLLYEIYHLDNSNPSKYSRAFLNLQSVFMLEEQEGFKIKSNLKNKFQDIQKKYNKFYSNIPLIVIEKYFYQNINNLNKFVYIEYRGEELGDMKVSELFYFLEQFFNQCFILASLLANYYNLEFKINKDVDKSQEDQQKDFI